MYVLAVFSIIMRSSIHHTYRKERETEVQFPSAIKIKAPHEFAGFVLSRFDGMLSTATRCPETIIATTGDYANAAMVVSKKWVKENPHLWEPAEVA